MGLVTRFFIIEPSDRPAQPGDIEHLDTLIAAYNDWVAEHLYGHHFNPAPVKLITSPYTIAQLTEDPEPRLNEAIIAATGDDGFWQHGMSTIAFPLGELLTGYYGANHLSPDHGCAICGDAIFYGLRGEGPPPGSPQWLIEQWPGGAWGGPIHEMIHTWGVEEHDAGIMLEHWLYPATFISPKDQAILLGSKFIQPPSPPNWLASNYSISDGAGCYHVQFDTDVMTVIEMVVSQKVPVSRRHYKIQRGLRVFCYYTWRLEDVTIIRYETLEDTHHHDFTYCPLDPTQPIYFYFRNRFQPETKSTKTPVMSALKGPTTLWEEPWDKTLIGNHPWHCVGTGCPPPSQPSGGILRLYCLPGGHLQLVETQFEDYPHFKTVPASSLTFRWDLTETSLSTWPGFVTIWVVYKGEEPQVANRILVFMPLRADCTLRDTLHFFPTNAGIRPCPQHGSINLGVLHDHPLDYCGTPFKVTNPHLDNLRLYVSSNPDVSNWMDIDYLGIIYQHPTMTHPPYKPTHPG